MSERAQRRGAAPGRQRPGRAKATSSTSRSSAPAGYSGTPLPKKLGIRPGSQVRLIGEPRDFRRTLGDLPEEARLKKGFAGEASLTLWFLRSRAALESGIEEVAEHLGGGSVWMIWPKKSSGVATDVTEAVLREAGLARGLVDYKVCAVDPTWSGLCFTRRRTPR